MRGILPKKPFKFLSSLKRNIHGIGRSFGMAPIEADRSPRQEGGKDSALGDWVRALGATAPIARNPQRLLFDVIAGHVASHDAAPALISAREILSFAEL